MSNRFRDFHRTTKQNITEDEINALCATNGNQGVDHSEEHKRSWRRVKTPRNDMFGEESISEIKNMQEKERDGGRI